MTGTSEKDRRRLIVGAATGYRPAQMRAFVESLRGVGYAGDVLMLVWSWDWRLKSYLQRHEIMPRAIWSTRRLHGPVATYRYQVYARLVRENRERYDEMMVTDTRDVVFQRHPFAGIVSPACHFYLEHPTLTIGEEPTNLRWARQFLPADQVTILSKHRISCCGIVAGGMAAMNEYLTCMAADLLLVPLRERRLGGADTSMHHRLAFMSERIAGVIVENDVHIATMGLGSCTYVVDADGLVRTADGHLPAILHQYDRVPHVNAAIQKRYSGKLSKLR